MFLIDSLTALAVVSGNDYNPNFFGYGLARNRKIILSIDDGQSSVFQLVNRYQETIDPSTPAFGHALQVFSNNREHTIATQREELQMDRYYAELLEQVEKLEDLRNEMRSARQEKR